MAKPATQTIEAVLGPGEDPERARAKVALSPTLWAAASLQSWLPLETKPTLGALTAELRAQSEAVQGGDLSRAEAMLTAQAHTLDAVFHHLAGRALANMGEYLGATETYLKLALRAQAQATRTWEVVSAIQNPPVAGYIKQANIAHGHQQVNNGSCAREIAKSANPTFGGDRWQQAGPWSGASGKRS